MRNVVATGAALLAATLLSPGVAQAAKRCGEPHERWERATPAEAGMDAAKVADAVRYASLDGTSSAVRVHCPPLWHSGDGRCRGELTATRIRKRAYDIAPAPTAPCGCGSRHGRCGRCRAGAG